MNNRKGFTFADIILILVLLAMIAASGMTFYVMLVQRHQGVTQQMTAINLATAQIEDLIALTNYADPLLIQTNPPATSGTITITIPTGYTFRYIITDEPAIGGMQYKSIRVTVITPGPIPRTIQLTGYKANI